VDHVGQDEVDLLALCKQMTAILAGQGVQQQVLGGSPRQHWYGEIHRYARAFIPMAHDGSMRRRRLFGGPLSASEEPATSVRLCPPAHGQ